MQTPVHNAILNDIANQCLLVYIIANQCLLVYIRVSVFFWIK